MKLGILGGSFNPVHIGHLFLAEKAILTLKLDRVIFVPAYRSPFKLEAEGMESSAKDRLKMLAAAVAGDSRFAIDDCEIRREGVSYTVDTLDDIITRFLPEKKMSLIVGDDIAPDLPNWWNSEKIFRLADIVVARRNNSGKENYPFPCIQIENEVMNVSSKIIRQKISEGGDWRSLVPSAAAAVIEDKRLYGFRGAVASEDCTQANILRIEAAARESLSTERFLHSRNTALFASDLCRRFGVDPAAGYLAGIAHDLAKQTDSKQLLKIAKYEDMEINAIEKERPNLLHGKVSAVLLRERFCIHNKDVLEAVAFHTMGSENMGPLAKIVYIADKAEVSRNIDPVLRKLCREGDLNSILFAVLEKTIFKLRSKELALSDDTLKLFDRMKEKRN